MVGFNYPPPSVWSRGYAYLQTYTMVIALSALRIEQAHAARLKSTTLTIPFVFSCSAHELPCNRYDAKGAIIYDRRTGGRSPVEAFLAEINGTMSSSNGKLPKGGHTHFFTMLSGLWQFQQFFFFCGITKQIIPEAILEILHSQWQ